MKIATWNVNSVRARMERLLPWLAVERPDVVCLQELKASDADFPRADIEAAGYAAVVNGQKTYNGVAILSRLPVDAVEVGMADGQDPPQARLVAATIAGVRVASVYVPNGEPMGSAKYSYKLEWLRRLGAWLDGQGAPGTRLVVCGDFNVIPDERDCWDPAVWEGTVLYNPEVRAALDSLKARGLVDVFRKLHAEPGHYSFWDYQALAFPRNLGLRIDYLLATPALAAVCQSARVDRDTRKGHRPSDHAAVVVEFDTG